MKSVSLFILLLLSIVVLNGCGPREVRAVPPGVSLESVAVVDRRIEINLLIENRNDHVIVLHTSDVQMAFDDTLLFETVSSGSLDIGPRGRESLRIATEAYGEGLELLQSTETARAYQLRGLLEFEDLRSYPLNLRGFLHPVPGQPGRYR